MDRFLNTAIMREPLNWLTVFLMCSFALIALYVVFPEASNESN